MSDENRVVEVVETQQVTQQPPVEEKKFFLLQQRFWALALGIGINVAMLVFVDGMSVKEAFKDETTVVMVALVTTMLLQVGGYASTVKGAKPTSLTRKGALAVQPPPTVTSSETTTTTTTTKTSGEGG